MDGYSVDGNSGNPVVTSGLRSGTGGKSLAIQAPSRLLALTVLLQLTTVACKPPVEPVPARRPPEAPVAIDSFYNAVGNPKGQARVEGSAATALTATDTPETRTLMSLDFEDGKFGVLQPVSNEQGNIKKLRELASVQDDPDGKGKALVIQGGLTGPASFRTGPLPVDEKAVYTLTYSVKTTDLAGGTGARYRMGTAEPLFYAIPSYNHDPAGALNNDEKRRRNGVKPASPIRGPEKQGTTGWETHTLQFTVPTKANYMVLSFDHSRTGDDKALPKPAAGTVFFDNITLTTTDRPLFQRYSNPDNLNANPHPLQLRVEQPAADRGAETRYALYAPAPSTLAFKRTIPENGRLSLAAGILREGWIPGKGTVTFQVDVVDASGKRTTAWDKALNPGKKESDRYWEDTVVDLSAWAGQEVSIELVTAQGDGAQEGSFPGAAACWGDPVLFSQKSGGRLVVLTVIDTVSVGHMSTYGYERETTPNLTRIGQRGVVFDTAYSAASWTLPSFASLFTGVDAVRHGAGERAWGEVVWRRPLPERFVTLAEQLRAQGFQTVAFMNNPYLTTTFGLSQGFTTYLDYGVGTKTGAGEIGVNHALDWLKSHQGYDRFMVVHLMDAHGPYRPPMAFALKFTSWFYSGRFMGQMGGQDYLDLAEGKNPAKDEATRQQVKNLYDGALAYADEQTGRLYDEVQKLAGTQDVTFIVTSDHGEELFEHGFYEHGHQAYNEMLKIPLILEAPAYFDGGRRIAEPVRGTDLVSTVLDLMKAPAPTGVDGFSLTSLLAGGKAAWESPRDIFAENQLYGSAQNALIRGPWKYLYNMKNTSRAERRTAAARRHELYQLEQDPGEQKNVVSEQKDVVQGLHKAMDRHVRPMMSGRYVLALDGGGAVKTFKGTLQLPPGANWFQHYEDMLAPLEDGGDGQLQVVIKGGQLQFLARTSRALLSFKPEKLPAVGSGLNMAITVDDQPWLEGMTIGNGTVAGVGLQAVRLSDEQLTIAPQTIPDAVDAKVSVFVGKTTERTLATEQQKELPPETEERLRALGYIQ